MPPKLPPISDLTHLKSKGDLIPEIYFCGQIVGAVDIQSQDALLCEMTLQTGQYWELIYPSKDKTYQTQTAYAQFKERGDVCMVASLRFPFQTKRALGMVLKMIFRPKIILKMWRFNDSSSTNDLLAYGVTYLPKTSGFNEIECEMWTPYGDWKFGALSYYMDSAPRLNNLNVLSKDLDKRKKIFSQPSGKIILEVETIRKNFQTLQVSD